MASGSRPAASCEGIRRSVPLSADVEGVDDLTLVVSAGGDGNGFDHADWADARLDCS